MHKLIFKASLNQLCLGLFSKAYLDIPLRGFIFGLISIYRVARSYNVVLQCALVYVCSIWT